MGQSITYFGADWCGPCNQQKPIMKGIEDEHDVDIEYLDVETDEGQSKAQEYTVRSLPTIVVESDDVVEETFIGITQEDEILSVIGNE